MWLQATFLFKQICKAQEEKEKNFDVTISKKFQN